MRIVAVDPSLTCTGLAAIDVSAGRVVEWKVLTSKPGGSGKGKTDDMADRLWRLGQEFRAFHRVHGGVIVIEGQVGASMGRAGMGSVFKLGAAYGAFLGACETRPIIIPPATVKHRLTGRMGATKSECYLKALEAFDLQGPGHLLTPPLPKSQAHQEAVQDAVSVAAAALSDVQQAYSTIPKEP